MAADLAGESAALAPFGLPDFWPVLSPYTCWHSRPKDDLYTYVSQSEYA